MEKNNIEINAIKIALLGDNFVGKTCICDTFSGLEFTEDNISTIGNEKFEKKIKLLNGKEIKLIYWDTAGQERFHAATLRAVRNVQGVILVFDVTSKNSFDNINMWLDDVKENFSNPSLVLLGNKIDKEKSNWQVTQEEIDSFTKKENMLYFGVSAKTNEGINESFNYLADTIYNKLSNNKEFEVEYSKENKKKVIKESKNESNNIKDKYDKLKKDYDILKKNYDKLKNDNDKLNDELNKAKNIISNIENKVKENLKEINNLKNIILQKDDEINILNLKLKNVETFNKKIFNDNDIISIHFISSDNNINCPIKCLKNDTFAEAEEKLYQKYQKYRETNNNFVSKGINVMRFKKIIENNINDGDKIELIKTE